MELIYEALRCTLVDLEPSGSALTVAASPFFASAHGAYHVHAAAAEHPISPRFQIDAAPKGTSSSSWPLIQTVFSSRKDLLPIHPRLAPQG